MFLHPASYSDEIIGLLVQNGERPIPLTQGRGADPSTRKQLAGRRAAQLFPDARSPEAALAGLWLYLHEWDEAHRVAQDVKSPDGSLWHGILHRIEGDGWNASYWFRQASNHPVFPLLKEAAEKLAGEYGIEGFASLPRWNPEAFVEFCLTAQQQPGSDAERFALAMQLAEWQILFDYCAQPRSSDRRGSV